MNEFLPRERFRFVDLWSNGTDCALVKIDTGHRLLNLERSPLARFWIDMVPIVKAEGHIAVFLCFKDDHIVQRMDGARAMKIPSPRLGAKLANCSSTVPLAIACRRTPGVVEGFRPA